MTDSNSSPLYGKISNLPTAPLVESLESRMLLSAAFLSNNGSTPTLCAEEDNVNIPMAIAKGRRHVSFTIDATHPSYDIGEDHRDADFTNCPPGGPSNGPQETIPLFDDHAATAVFGVRDPNFHQPPMTVRVGKTVASGIHFIRIIRRIANTDSWPEVLVLYSDGNLRLKPQAPESGNDPVFGSSVIVGPAARVDRPVANIKSVTYVPATDSLKVSYRHGGRATLRIARIDRSVARIVVNGFYDARPNLPFATFRSMFVEDGNTDVDQIRWHDSAGTHDEPIMAFKSASASSFFFGREIWSKHNSSAPDILVSHLRLSR
ncbi:MAG TPA: hypothetical protein VGP99_07495 [Tepidisphaeraceae bacterium]|jgi:hypothetical protein|nr:hypothetical protein [Tepidisphaeraceae bacterium]